MDINNLLSLFFSLFLSYYKIIHNFVIIYYIYGKNDLKNDLRFMHMQHRNKLHLFPKFEVKQLDI